MQYSAYEKTGDGTWVGVHRLPLKMAIMYCQELRSRHFCKVALVPDNTDPKPYFQFVLSLA